MRTVFAEWYAPNEDEISEFMKLATVALDANALLALYRVNQSQRDQIIKVLTTVKARLFVPYQAALEYQRHRMGVLSEYYKVYDEILTQYQSAKARALNLLRDDDLKKRVAAAWDAGEPELKATLTSLQNEHGISPTDGRIQDSVRAALDALLTADRIGTQPSLPELSAMYEAAESRYAEKIPPGYKDDNKPVPERYGDYLLWCELLKCAASTDLPMLLITDDRKEDWYEKSGGPRIDLRREMQAKSSTNYHQMTLSSFLLHAKEYLGVELDDDTIEGVKEPPQKPSQRTTFGIDGDDDEGESLRKRQLEDIHAAEHRVSRFGRDRIVSLIRSGSIMSSRVARRSVMDDPASMQVFDAIVVGQLLTTHGLESYLTSAPPNVWNEVADAVESARHDKLLTAALLKELDWILAKFSPGRFKDPSIRAEMSGIDDAKRVVADSPTNDAIERARDLVEDADTKAKLDEARRLYRDPNVQKAIDNVRKYLH